MFNNEFFKDPTLVAGTGGGTTDLDPAAVEAIIDAHVTEAYLDAKNLSATTLKDTRTAPTELPPAKYARTYGGEPDPHDSVFQALNAQIAENASIATTANALDNIPANKYALKYDGTVATQHTVYGATNADMADASLTSMNADQLGGEYANKYARKDENTELTQHTVYNANNLGTYAASMYAQKTDLTEYIKTTDLASYAKQNDGTVATQHTVYNALNLGGMASADYLNIPNHIQYFGSSNRVWIDIVAASGMNIPQTALTTGQGDYAKYIYLYSGGLAGAGSGDLRMRHSSWYPSGQRNNVEICIHNNTDSVCQLYMPSDTPSEDIQGSGATGTLPNRYFTVNGRSLIQLKYRPPTSAGGSGGRWFRIIYT